MISFIFFSNILFIGNEGVGFPVIRTPVNDGTAFDQAGKVTAIEESLLNAIEYGIKLL